MLHGNIYPAAKVPQALTNFFRTDNLIALRELALRFLADETEEELLEHLARYHTEVLWETSERILVSVTTAPGTDAIVRRASRMAARIKAELHAVHVTASDRAKRSDEAALALLRQLCVDVGADWTELEADDPAQAIVDYAKRQQITQIIIGSSQRGRFQELMGGGSTVRKVSRSAAEAGIDVHIIARRDVGDVSERVVRADPGQDG
jgi:two-component system sensor histidine kinase KdpD